MNFLVMLFVYSAFAQTPPTLETLSEKINEDLPEVIDRMTKIRKTTVENNHLTYHVLVDATPAESATALPKVKQQILSTICSNKRQRMALMELNAPIVYRYENVKGQSVGEFMVPADLCKKTSEH
ncbi:MAG: hypothetical protein ACJ76H_01115 [Bacteriovoracaceae bacterium]